MDNQHKFIKGYRDLSKREIDLINEAKVLAERVGLLVTKLEELQLSEDPKAMMANAGIHIDRRWLSIGKTDLQKGFMAVIRSIAQPETF